MLLMGVLYDSDMEGPELLGMSEACPFSKRWQEDVELVCLTGLWEDLIREEQSTTGLVACNDTGANFRLQDWQMLPRRALSSL